MLQNPELHYLDNAATTIVAPEVADVINKAMREHWANPSSLYGPVRRSEEALNAARAAVAARWAAKAGSCTLPPAAARATIWPCWVRYGPAPSARASWCPALSTPVSSARWRSWQSRATTLPW